MTKVKIIKNGVRLDGRELQVGEGVEITPSLVTAWTLKGLATCVTDEIDKKVSVENEKDEEEQGSEDNVPEGDENKDIEDPKIPAEESKENSQLGKPEEEPDEKETKTKGKKVK